MTDALVFTVPTPIFAGKDGVERERYATANAISDHGATRGKKSDAYLALFRAVREAARAEMARTGWETWPHPCEVEVVRYHRTQRLCDAGNLGKCELDSMRPSTPHEDRRDGAKPFPGVFVDDVLARPYHADAEFDPNGPDRVLIVVRRRFPDIPAEPISPKNLACSKRKRPIVVARLLL